MRSAGQSRLWWLAAAVWLLAGCSAGIPFLGVTVRAVDEADNPLAGVTVYSSAGERQLTAADGQVRLSFTAIGNYTINVEATERMPMTLQANFPLDAGKTLTARLAKIVPAPPLLPSAAAKVSGSGPFPDVAGLSTLFSTQLYPMIFHSLFSAGGFSLDLAPYEPGAWTEWRVNGDPADESALLLRKALLKRLATGEEWWQVRVQGDEERQSLLFEVLFSADKQTIRRMRQAGRDGKPAEIPVNSGWYVPPRKLSSASLAAALSKRDETIKVPAGSYRADRYDLATPESTGKIRLWQTKGVPGGVVKTLMFDEGTEEAWRAELTASGSGARSEWGGL